MTLARFFAVWSVVATAACSSGSVTSPSRRLVSLGVSEEAVSIPRTESSALRAFATYADGFQEDVTSTAAWTSSNESVIRVSGGVTTALGIGRGTIVATFGGLSDSVSVSARRRVQITGAVTASCEPTAHIVAGLEAVLDGSVLSRADVGSDHTAVRTMQVRFGSTKIVPGVHTLKVVVYRFGFLSFYDDQASPHSFTASPAPVLSIVDTDTAEEVKQIVLSPQEIRMRNSGAFSWDLEVPEFTQ